jgi:hypothetical protein
MRRSSPHRPIVDVVEVVVDARAHLPAIIAEVNRVKGRK